MSKYAVLACLVAAIAAPGCRKPRSSNGNAVQTPAPEFDRQALLTAFGTCAMTTYTTFHAANIELRDATAKYSAERTEANTAAVRTAWNKAIDAWQQAELMQFGPAAESTAKGGRGMRAEIYFAPPARCAIDQVTAAKSWEEPGFMSGALPNMRGLSALEYLLFDESVEHGCSTPIANWGDIAAELKQRKATFAKLIADDLPPRSAALIDAWDPAKGNFLAAFATAGKGSTVYPTALDALNAVSDALFYLDTETKDDKLGDALDINCDAGTCCTAPPCLDRLESRYAKRSKEHIRNNLIGFRKLFTGCEADFKGLGFDDLLVAIKASNLAEEMDADLVAAIAVVDAYPYATLDEGLAKDPAAVRKIYDAIKQITDALKTEFISVLALKIPATGAGDAD